MKKLWCLIAGSAVLVFALAAPASAQTCNSALSTTSVLVATGWGGTFTITVTGSCAWTATSHSSFIRIISGSTGNGAGTVTFDVDDNQDGISRNGDLTIAGQTVTVSQPSTDNGGPCVGASPGGAYVPVWT